MLPLGHFVPQTSFNGAVSHSVTPVADLGDGSSAPSDVFIFPHLMVMESSGILEAIEFDLSDNLLDVLSQFEGNSVQFRFQVYRPVCVEPNTELLSCPDSGGLGSCYPINNASCSEATSDVSSYRYFSYIPHYTLVGMIGINMTEINSRSHHLVIFGSEEEISVESGDVFGLQFEATSDYLPFRTNSDNTTTVVQLLFSYENRRWVDIGEEAPNSNFSYLDMPQPLIRVYIRFPTVLFPPLFVSEQLLAEVRGINQTVLVFGRNVVGEAEQSTLVIVYDPVVDVSLVCPKSLLGDGFAVATNKSTYFVIAIEQGTSAIFHYKVNDGVYNVVPFTEVSRDSVLCYDYEDSVDGGGIYAAAIIPILFTMAGTYDFHGIASNPLNVTDHINFTITVQDVITLHGILLGHVTLKPMEPVVLAKGKEHIFEVVVTGGIPMSFDWYFSNTNGYSTTLSNFIGHVFSSVGDDIVITVRVSNDVSAPNASGLVSVQEPIDGLEVIPSDGFVPVNDSVVFLVLLSSGSHVSYQWIFMHEDTQERFFFDPVEHGGHLGDMLNYTFEREGRYVLQLDVFNSISNSSASIHYTALQKVSLVMTVDSAVKLGSSVQLDVFVEGTPVNLTVSSSNQTETFLSILSSLFQTNITLSSVGNHTITATATNPVSSATAITYVLVEEAINITGFVFNETVPVGDVMIVHAVVSAGSNILFKWEVNGTSISSDPVLTFYPRVSGLYFINVTALNAVSHTTALIGPVTVAYPDSCVFFPCANGGRCHLVHQDYQCLCPFGWEGERCLTGETKILMQFSKNY